MAVPKFTVYGPPDAVPYFHWRLVGVTPSVTVRVVPFALVAMFWVVKGAIDVAELLMLMFVPLSEPFTVGDDETTRILYPTPAKVPEGIVAEID